MHSIHATKKLLDRVKRPVADPVGEPLTMLGNWYANALFWKPQVALLVNERTLLPVFMPLAPAAAMAHASFAKTADRSVVGSMNDFAYPAAPLR